MTQTPERERKMRKLQIVIISLMLFFTVSSAQAYHAFDWLNPFRRDFFAEPRLYTPKKVQSLSRRYVREHTAWGKMKEYDAVSAKWRWIRFVKTTDTEYDHDIYTQHAIFKDVDSGEELDYDFQLKEVMDHLTIVNTHIVHKSKAKDFVEK